MTQISRNPCHIASRTRALAGEMLRVFGLGRHHVFRTARLCLSCSFVLCSFFLPSFLPFFLVAFFLSWGLRADTPNLFHPSIQRSCGEGRPQAVGERPPSLCVRHCACPRTPPPKLSVWLFPSSVALGLRECGSPPPCAGRARMVSGACENGMMEAGGSRLSPTPAQPSHTWVFTPRCSIL